MMRAEIKPMKTAAEAALAEAFAAVRATLPGDRRIAERRAAAFQTFDACGLPHRRVEEWKYTDLRALIREAKPLAAAPDAQAKQRAKRAGKLLAGIGARRITFVDGAFVAELSDLAALEPGLSIVPMAKALAEGDSLVASRLGAIVPTDDVAVALNTAFMGDGALVHISRNTKLERPIHLVFVFGSDSASAAFTRSLIVVEEGAQATLIESHEGPDGIDYQVNTALELFVGDQAQVDHVKIGTEGARAIHVSTLMASIGAHARLRDLVFTTGGAVVRNQLFVRFAGEGATLALNGANLIKGRQHVDNTLVVDHAVPGGFSRELNKSVLDGESRSVFQGKIIVRPGAQKTDGKMMTQALLLSEDAEADNKPELEIFADDVQCGHGATAGALDRNLLFYLKTRGIPQAEAEALLIQAFVGEAIETLAHEGVKDALMGAAAEWLRSREQ
jgi:Fe-S cluster assembly protein SufD